jgi:hypothetical protein
MRHELTELTATWLGDATYGVNANLAGVTRKAGDAVPTDIAISRTSTPTTSW